MKGIFLLCQNRALGKKLVFYEDIQKDILDPNTALKKFQGNVTTLPTANEGKRKKSHYGLPEKFFNEMFLPNVDAFKNDIFDIIVE